MRVLKLTQTNADHVLEVAEIDYIHATSVLKDCVIGKRKKEGAVNFQRRMVRINEE